jgi:Flp pilus assembly protein TadD
VNQARKLEEQGKVKQALALYEQAAALVPTNSVVLSRLAFGYLNRSRNAAAAEYATRAVVADAGNSEGWIELGAAREQLGDRKAAREAYRQCVALGRGEYVAECRRMVR